jgi:predicted transcriptional regulator
MSVPVTLRLSDADATALRRCAEREARSMHVAKQAIRKYIEDRTMTESFDNVLDQELSRYAEALDRLGQ